MSHQREASGRDYKKLSRSYDCCLRINQNGNEPTSFAKEAGLMSFMRTASLHSNNHEWEAHPLANPSLGEGTYNTALCGFAVVSGSVSTTAATLVCHQIIENKVVANHAQLRDIRRMLGINFKERVFQLCIPSGLIVICATEGRTFIFPANVSSLGGAQPL